MCLYYIMDYDKILLSIFFTTKLNRHKCKKYETNIERYVNISEYLLYRFDFDVENYKESLYRLFNNDFDMHVCKFCHKPINYFQLSNFCSQKCRRASQVEQVKLTSLKRYGVTNPAQVAYKNRLETERHNFFKLSREQKIHKILFDNRGLRKPNLGWIRYSNVHSFINNMFDDSYSFEESLKRFMHLYSDKFNNEQKKLILHKPKCPTCGKPTIYVGRQRAITTAHCSNTCSGNDKNVIYKKQKEDRLKNNGKLGWNKNTPEKIQHRLNTIRERYGDGDKEKANKYIRDLCIKGTYDKYGVTAIMSLPEFMIKRNNTIRERYGVDHILEVPEIQIKKNETVKKNKKYIISKQENEVYDILKNEFPDIIRFYSSQEYKWCCDFYIPSLNMYIEFQGSHYHYGKPYVGDDNDLLEIEKLKQKSENVKKKYGRKKTQYDNIIYTWSDLDVRKRNTAKENNLNFAELWSIDDAYKFIENYKHKIE